MQSILPAVVNKVLGVDERKSIPLPLHFEFFENMFVRGLTDGCNERFFRFFVFFADDDE